MASSNFTPNLHLNAWADSDRPKRVDFVSDNSIIDTVLGEHIANSGIHVTADEKAKISEPYLVSGYAGSGESQRTISLAFRPKMVFIFKRGVPFVTYSGGVSIIHAACGVYGYGASAGMSITGSGVLVSESSEAVNGVKSSLNESGMQYTLIAFK